MVAMIIVLLIIIGLSIAMIYYASTHKTGQTGTGQTGTQSQSPAIPVSTEKKPSTSPPPVTPTTSPLQSPTTPGLTNNCCRNIDYSDPIKKIKNVVSSWKDCRPCNEVVPGCLFLPNAESCNDFAPLCKWSNNKCYNVKNVAAANTVPCDATITNTTCVDYTKLALYEP